MKMKGSAEPWQVSGVQDRDTRDFYWIARYGILLAFGVMVASLEALRPGMRFQVTAGTLLAFAGGAVAANMCWRVMWRAFTGGREKAVLFWGCFLFLALLAVGCFLYPLRFVQSEKLHDIFPALSMVVLAVSFWGCALRRLHLFFRTDEEETEAGDESRK